MEEELKSLSKSLGGFCNHLQISCDAFNHSLQRRPIPLDSASSTFINSLNCRVSTASSELSFLDSMSFGTVSFEELLGHCSQIYKNNQENLLHIQDHLTDFGYIPEIEIDEGKDEESGVGDFVHKESKHLDDDFEPHSLQRSIKKGLDKDDLLYDSLNLKNLGLSDACLATLASEGNDDAKILDMPSLDISALHPRKASELSNTYGHKCSTSTNCCHLPEDEHAKLEMDRTSGPTLTLIKEEYENLPSFMKSLASWEDLLSAVQKFNSVLGSKKQTNGSYYIRADEIPTLGLGHKEKAYTLLLTRMKRHNGRCCIL